MGDYLYSSLGQVSEPDRDSQNDPISRKVNLTNTFALMKAVVELKVLDTTTSTLRATRNTPESVFNAASALHRAIDRREKRIAEIIDSMTKDGTEKNNSNLTWETLPQPDMFPTPEASEQSTTAEDVSHRDERRLRRVLFSDSSTRTKLNCPVSKGPTAAVEGGIAEHGQLSSAYGDGVKETGSGFFSAVPTPTSGSINSSMQRSLSVSNVHSVSSGPRQCMVVSAAQYTRIVTEPQFSIVSQPWSIDSLVAESTRIDRSALEINEVNEHRHTRSADSFPGEFPISDGLEYSSLATAKNHLRIPSMRTSVRPFSEL